MPIRRIGSKETFASSRRNSGMFTPSKLALVNPNKSHSNVSRTKDPLSTDMRIIATASGRLHFELPSVNSFKARLTRQMLAYTQADKIHSFLDIAASDSFDSKTGWPFDFFRESTLETLMYQAQQPGQQDWGAYGVLDIINLNGINAAAGYTQGQQIFGAITRIIRDTLLQETDIVLFRHGGDEFSMCLPGPNAEDRLQSLLFNAHEQVTAFVQTPYITADNTILNLATISHPKRPFLVNALGTGFLAATVKCNNVNTKEELIKIGDQKLELAKARRLDGQPTTKLATQADIKRFEAREQRLVNAIAQHTNPLFSSISVVFNTILTPELQAIRSLGVELGAPDATIDELINFREKTNYDHLTGFGKLEARDKQLTILLDAGKPFMYVDCDITNLGGMNAYLSAQVADRVIVFMAHTFEQQLGACNGADAVQFYRHGGDEFCAVILAASPNFDLNTIETHLQKTRSKINQVVKLAGLNHVVHSKYPLLKSAAGTGLKFGIVDARTCQGNLKHLLAAADRDLLARFGSKSP